MTHVVKLFGDITAEQTEKGTFVVRKGEKQVSPYEYIQVRRLNSNCYALFRMSVKKYDLIFGSGTMLFGCHFAYELEKIGDSKQKSLIGAGILHGTHILDDSGNYLAFIPRHYHVAIAGDKFLIAIIMASPEPFVRVYDLFGGFLVEGFLNKALEEARCKVWPPSQLA